MQRARRTNPAIRRGRAGSRVSAAGSAANGSNEKGRHGPLRGPRAGDRFALTVISLALDEVDATAVLTGATEPRVRRELSPTSPYASSVAVAMAPSLAGRNTKAIVAHQSDAGLSFLLVSGADLSLRSTMSKLSRAFWVVVVLLLLAGLVYVAVRAVDKDPAVFGSVVAACGAVVLAVAQRRWEKKQELERLHREEIAPVYEELVDRLKDMEKVAAEAQNQQFFKDLTTQLLIHGSSAVIKAWLAWRLTRVPEDPDDLRLVLAYEQVLWAIRRDLGHDDSALAQGDLLRTYVNDFDEAVLRRRAKQALQLANPGAE